MTGQRKYWKSYAKSNLKGNWGIAIAAMLAVVAVNFIGNIFAVQLFPGDSVFALVLSEIFVFIVSLIGMIFSTGYSYMQLNICRGRDYSLSDLLYMFHNQPDRVLVAGLVVALIDTVVQIPFYYVTYMGKSGRDCGKHDSLVSASFGSVASCNGTECDFYSAICTDILFSG